MSIAWGLTVSMALVAAWIGICMAAGIPDWAQVAGGIICGVLGAKLTT